MQKERLRYQNVFAFMVIGAMVSVYLWILLRYTSFMPIEDDYSAVLGFLSQFVQENDWSKKIQMLFHQNADHRIVFTLLIEVLQYKLTGEVNFVYLVLLGNIGWFLLIYLLWRDTSKSYEAQAPLFLPVVVMMLSFTHASLMTWAMGSLQQYWQLFFSLLSIYLLVNRMYYRAYVFMTVAIFTGGGGFALIPIFLLYYLIHRAWKQIFLTLFLSLLIGVIYFVLLHFHWQQRTPHLLMTIMQNADIFLKYIMTFLGNFGAVNPYAMLIGTVLVGLFVLNTGKVYRNTPFIWWSILFVISTAFVAGISRFMHGPEQALSSRYSIYSTLLAVLLYLAYIRIVSRKVVFVAGMVVSMVVFVLHWQLKLPLFEYRKHRAETALAFPTPSFAEKALKHAYEERVFTQWEGRVKMPSTLTHIPSLDRSNPHCIWINQVIRSCSESSWSKTMPLMAYEGLSLQLHIVGWSVDLQNKKSPYAIILTLGDRNKVVFLKKRPDIVQKYHTSTYLYSGIDVEIALPPLKQGEHRLEIKTVNTEASGYYKTASIPIVVNHLDAMNPLKLANAPIRGSLEHLAVEEEKLILSGWYILEGRSSKDLTVIVEIDGKKHIADSNQERSDVAKILQDRKYLYSGFHLEVPLKHLVKGMHTVRLFLYDGRSLYDTGEIRTIGDRQ